MIRTEIKRAGECVTSVWSGGETTEIYIHPPGSVYGDRTFDFRISSATVTLESSEFTALPGFMRYIMLLEGDMHLDHEGHHSKTLERYGQDYFDGAWTTHSAGRCVDLNLMLGEGVEGSLGCVRGPGPVTCDKPFCALFALRDGVEVRIPDGAGGVLAERLNRRDFLTVWQTEPIRDVCIEVGGAALDETPLCVLITVTGERVRQSMAAE